MVSPAAPPPSLELSPIWDPAQWSSDRYSQYLDQLFSPRWLPVGAHYVAHAEAVSALCSLPNGSLHAAIMDPPYCSGGQSEAERVSAKSQGVRSCEEWFQGDAMTGFTFARFLERIGQTLVAKLNPKSGMVLCFTDTRMSDVVKHNMQLSGLRHRGTFIWYKGGPGLGRGIKPAHENIELFTVGARISANEHLKSVLEAPRIHHTKKCHPTEKPQAVLRALVRMASPPGGLVCDPFCGSGSLGLAADAEGRRAVISDWNPKYAQMAAKRLLAASELVLPDAPALFPHPPRHRLALPPPPR